MTMLGHTLLESVEIFYSKTTSMSCHGQEDRKIYLQWNTSGSPWIAVSRENEQIMFKPNCICFVLKMVVKNTNKIHCLEKVFIYLWWR